MSNRPKIRWYLWWRWQQIVCAVKGHIWLVHGDGEGTEWNCCERCGWNDEPFDEDEWSYGRLYDLYDPYGGAW